MTNFDQNQQQPSNTGKTSWKPTPGWIVGAAFVVIVGVFGTAAWEAVDAIKADQQTGQAVESTQPSQADVEPVTSDEPSTETAVPTNETLFVRYLWRDVPQFKTLTRQQTINAGQTACQLKDLGHSDIKVLRKAHNLLGISMDDATTFVGYSFNVFCPEYSR